MTDLEKIRYKVFKDLWTKGYYLTCGMKFGGDFLIYEGKVHKSNKFIQYFNSILFYLGDPLAYHAKYIVNCRDANKQIMVSSSRVSSITNKKMVIAQVNGDLVKYLIYNFNDSSQAVDKKPINFIIH